MIEGPSGMDLHRTPDSIGWASAPDRRSGLSLPAPAREVWPDPCFTWCTAPRCADMRCGQDGDGLVLARCSALPAMRQIPAGSGAAAAHSGG